MHDERAYDGAPPCGGLCDVTYDVWPEARHEILDETSREEVAADLVT